MATIVKYIFVTALREAGMIARVVYSAVIALSYILTISAVAFGWPPADKVPWWVPALVGTLAAIIFLIWMIGKHAQEVDEKLRPKIQVTYEGPPACRKAIIIKDRSTQPPTKSDGISIRAKVGALSSLTISGCQPYLTKIEMRQADGTFQDCGVYEPVVLPWAVQANEFEPVDIVPNIAKFFGIVFTNEKTRAFEVRTQVFSLVSPLVFSDSGTYRITIQVKVIDMPTVPLIIDIFWSGEWDKIQAYVV